MTKEGEGPIIGTDLINPSFGDKINSLIDKYKDKLDNPSREDIRDFLNEAKKIVFSELVSHVLNGMISKIKVETLISVEKSH